MEIWSMPFDGGDGQGYVFRAYGTPDSEELLIEITISDVINNNVIAGINMTQQAGTTNLLISNLYTGVNPAILCMLTYATGVFAREAYDCISRNFKGEDLYNCISSKKHIFGPELTRSITTCFLGGILRGNV